MDWLKAAQTGANFPNQTAKYQEIDFRLKQDKHRANTFDRNKDYCEYHGSKDWPCWDCEIAYHEHHFDESTSCD